MTSKVLVKLPVVPFSQRKKPPTEIIALPGRNDDVNNGEGRFQGHQSDKATQLEQNMKFLQEQHQVTLVALHQEVEVLRQKNRDLQFQLVFSKGNTIYSSPSSPENSGNNGIAKVKQQQQESPTCVNITPLQVELLEKELQDVKTTLNETKKQNVYLTEIVEKQKKTIEAQEKPREKPKSLDVGLQIDRLLECQQVELQARLDEAEILIKRLRQESEEQRRENASLKAALASSSSSSSSAAAEVTAARSVLTSLASSDSVAPRPEPQHSNSSSSSSSTSSSRHSIGSAAYGNRHRAAAVARSACQGSSSESRSVTELRQQEDDNCQKFPPLQTQSYWYRASSSRAKQSSYEQSGLQQEQQQQQQQGQQPAEYQRNNTRQRQQQIQENLEARTDGGMLPQLRHGSVRVDNSASCPPFYRSRNHNKSGKNYYKDERIGRKYKGQQVQRERREQISREYHHHQHGHINNYSQENQDAEGLEQEDHQRQHQYHHYHHNQQQQQQHHHHHRHHHQYHQNQRELNESSNKMCSRGSRNVPRQQ